MVASKALKSGLTLSDFETLTIGMVVDLIGEVNSPEEEKKQYATTADIAAF